jgi:hypothetical protein
MSDDCRASAWYNGNLEGEKQSAERGVALALELWAEDQGLILVGPLIYYTLMPDDERVVDPPAHWAGGNPICLVGVSSTEEKSEHLLTKESGFTHELEPQDLEKLRQIHRKHYALENPVDVAQNGNLTDEECDGGINEMGPQVAMEGLKRYKQVLN